LHIFPRQFLVGIEAARDIAGRGLDHVKTSLAAIFVSLTSFWIALSQLSILLLPGPD
jgi:hypothetical protein